MITVRIRMTPIQLTNKILTMLLQNERQEYSLYGFHHFDAILQRRKTNTNND